MEKDKDLSGSPFWGDCKKNAYWGGGGGGWVVSQGKKESWNIVG